MLPGAYHGDVRLVVLAAAALLAFAATAHAAFIRFRAPTGPGTIGCIYSSKRVNLRCDILSGLNPPPGKPHDCQLDWTYGYQIHRTGRTRMVCAGVEAVDTRANVLRYGHRWKRGGFNCFSSKAGLRCHNLSGHGFFISRRHSYRF
jgi:hypothetical protein